MALAFFDPFTPLTDSPQLVHQRTDPEVMRRFCEFWGVPPVDQPEAASFPHAPRDPELQDRLANLSERVHLAAAQELAPSRQPSQSPERSQSTQRSRSMGTATEFTSSIHTSPVCPPVDVTSSLLAHDPF